MLKFDRLPLRGTSRTKTAAGFLRVPATLTRTGVFGYRAGELGLDGDPDRMVHVLRTEESVSDPSSMASLRGAPVTLDHPADLTPKTFQQEVVGSVAGDPVIREGTVQSDLLIGDAKAIAEIEDGSRVELSVGYDFNMEPARPGDNADYRTRGAIDYEHVAVVASGRAGQGARIFDSRPARKEQPVDPNQIKAVIQDALKEHLAASKQTDGAPAAVDSGAISGAIATALKPVLDEVRSVSAAQQKAADEQKAADVTAAAEKQALALTDAATTAERTRAQVYADAAPFLPEDKRKALIHSDAKEILVAALQDKLPDAATQEVPVLAGFLKGLTAAGFPNNRNGSDSAPATGPAIGARSGSLSDANSPTAQARAKYVRFLQDAHRGGTPKE